MNRRVVGGAALLALAAATYSLWPTSAKHARSAEEEDSFKPAAPASNAAGAPARPDPAVASSSPSAPTPDGVTAGDPRFDHRADRVSHALEMLRYPPTSQPLRKDMKDILQPNRRWETPLPLALAQGMNAKDATKTDLSFELTGDAFAITGQSTLTATLEVFHAADHARIAVDITSAALTTVDTGKQVANVSLTDDGNHLYRAAITPAAVDGLRGYRGAVKLDVAFVPSEGDPRPAQATLDFKYSGSTPATFAGVSNDKLVPEGLEVDVDHDVTEPGQFFVQGCIFDAKNEPIGFAVARPTLEKGKRSVPLVFFGLLFRDANAAGPYVFKTLTGNRMPAPGEADHAAMDPWTGTYRTRPYALADFSDHEWESPQKDAKIQALGDLAAKAKAKNGN